MKYILMLCFCPLFLWAQQDTIILPDLVVTDYRLSTNQTQFVQTLSDSVLDSNPPLLTEILNYNTPIYFKENGYGMVSSPSFRGTTASQTSVLWNGIRINSGFLGQTDFNTVSSLGYDEIQIKAGGGSVAHGSGAIGGSIHLNHQLPYDQGLKVKTVLGYGSYNTTKFLAKIHHSTPKLANEISYNHNSSDNDYEVEKFNYKNLNGAFYNHALNVNSSYKFNAYNKLSLFIEGYQDDRHFSLIQPTASKTRYKNRNFRSLLQYENQLNKLSSIIRMAWLNEKWKYFENIDGDFASMGDLSTFTTKYDGIYHWNETLNTSLIGELSFANAVGQGSGIDHVSNTSGNLGLMLSHDLHPKISYELGIRKEMNKTFESPLLFSIGVESKPVDWYEVKVNFSKNFRAPTYNDLYWEPGGNLNLKAENSLQLDWSNSITYKKNIFTMNLYHYNISDMIRWLPTTEGYWAPINTHKVKSSGIEIIADLQHNYGNHHFNLASSYAYTRSINTDTDKQLTYVPKHKMNGTLTYQFHQFSAYVQALYVGEIFTTTDENAHYVLEDYQIYNSGVYYQLGKKNKYKLGLHVKNLLNLAYKAYPNRVMRPRNFMVDFIAHF